MHHRVKYHTSHYLKGRFWTATILLFLLVQAANAQISRSAFFLEEVPASNLLNPAFHPECNFYINIPRVSSFYLGFESPFTFEELTNKWEQGDSLYIDRERIMQVLEDKNYFSFELYNEFARGGVRLGRHFIHLNLAKVFSTKFTFDKDLASLLLYGNGHENNLGKVLTINDVGLNMSSYHEFAIAYSVLIGNKITAGTRLKYLNGAFNILTAKSEFELYTDDDPNFPITAASDIEIYTSSTISSFDNLIDQVTDYKWFDLSENHGYGFDLGVEYNVTPKVKISVSAIDFGWITWKENTKYFKSANPDEEYTFKGFDINDFVNNGSFADTVDVLDTIIDHFKLLTTEASYTSHLSPKIYLGGIWRFTQRNDAGWLVRTDITEEKMQFSFTVNYTHRFGRVLSLNANYSWVNNNFYNFGVGMVAKLGPVQLYALNDMVFGLINGQKARNYNFHIGLGLLFGTPKSSISMPSYTPTTYVD